VNSTLCVSQPPDFFSMRAVIPISYRATVSLMRDVGNANRHLEGTYLIRLFAEFETGLRLYWETVKNTHPKTEPLLNSIATRQKISHDLINAIHQVRKYRNSLVHEREDETTPVSLSSARSTICHFLSRLPESWT